MESARLLDLKNPFPNDDEESVEALLELMSINPGEIQNQVLEEILLENSKTEYLARFFSDDDDADEVKQVFKKKVPLVEYADLWPYIERIANGEPHHIVSADPIPELIVSSGTTGGKCKLFPCTAQQLSLQASVLKLGRYILNKNTFVDQPLRAKRIFLYAMAREFTTPGHLVARSGIASLLRKNLAESPSSNLSDATCSPEVLLCMDAKQSMYTQLLCGLLHRESVITFGTVFAAGFVHAIKFLEQHWEELCCNIRQGNISDWIDDPKCKRALSSILSRPMPHLADAISEECENKPWQGIIKKLWPGAKCIETVVTGSMAQYIPKVEFYGGGLPIVSMFYGASEGNFGINLNPLIDPYDISYCFVPWMAYYEFLPVDPISVDDAGTSNGRVVDLVDVKIGQRYELVVTTFSGLNRYRVGDILMVTAFHNNAPQFRFVRRKNVILSLLTEMTTEEDLVKATSNATNILEQRGFFLTEYTSYADSRSVPGHYVLFWELQNHGGFAKDKGFDEMMKECCNFVDESLNERYRYYRIRYSIGPLEIKVVKEGMFDALMDFTISRQKSSSLSQYKPLKCITSEDSIQMLNSMVVATFFSE